MLPVAGRISTSAGAAAPKSFLSCAHASRSPRKAGARRRRRPSLSCTIWARSRSRAMRRTFRICVRCASGEGCDAGSGRRLRFARSLGGCARLGQQILEILPSAFERDPSFTGKRDADRQRLQQPRARRSRKPWPEHDGADSQGCGDDGPAGEFSTDMTFS